MSRGPTNGADATADDLGRVARPFAAVPRLDIDDVERDLDDLLHRPLTVLRRAEALARYKALYVALHPQTQPVTVRGGPGRGRKSNETACVFCSYAAQRTGRSRRTVERDVRIGERLNADAKDGLRGTCVEDCKGDLLRLAGMPVAEQIRIATLIGLGKAKSVRDALALDRYITAAVIERGSDRVAGGDHDHEVEP